MFISFILILEVPILYHLFNITILLSKYEHPQQYACGRNPILPGVTTYRCQRGSIFPVSLLSLPRPKSDCVVFPQTAAMISCQWG
jgi:hypothetical protein